MGKCCVSHEFVVSFLKLSQTKIFCFFALISSSAIWGLSPLFYRELIHIDPQIVMAYRVISSCLFLFVCHTILGNLLDICSLVKSYKTFALIVFASIMIGINQFGFIYSISVNQVIQASFAYYIFPLIAVFFGGVFLKEKFSKLQMLALVLALVSVIFLAMGLGYIPFISLLLGFTFAIYGLIKTVISVDSLQSVFLELSLISPVAFGYLLYLRLGSSEVFFDISTRDYYLLIASGLITAVPLFFFSFATLGLNYSTVGLVNYLNPTLQFLIAVLIFTEPFSNTHAIGFLLIWISLFFYSLDSVGGTFFKSRRISSTD